MWSDNDKLLALTLLPHTGSAAYWKLIDIFGDHQGLLDAVFGRKKSHVLNDVLHQDARALIAELHVKEYDSALAQHVKTESRLAETMGVRILPIWDKDYPKLLRDIKRAPPLLYVWGDVHSLSLPQIAIVGSRSPTPLGRQLAFDFASQLSANGFVVTSGLALGIDGDAHRGALHAGAKTVAVLGSGLAAVYPKRHQGLANEIVSSGGALVSEFPLSSGALRQNFPQRNRVVSGLSIGTLVVEAAVKSGSLITARYALQQNREVFAIPGSIRSPNSKGCHAMIKSGAKLVENTKDIVAELGHMLDFHREQLSQATEATLPKEEALSGDERALLNAIGFESTSMDEIACRINESATSFSEALLHLELKGLIENTGLGYTRI